MRTRVLALILAFLGVLTLAGCAGKESGPEREGILTGVFRGTEYPLSDGWIPGRYVTPRYDPESGEFICLLQKMTETENEDVSDETEEYTSDEAEAPEEEVTEEILFG